MSEVAGRTEGVLNRISRGSDAVAGCGCGHQLHQSDRTFWRYCVRAARRLNLGDCFQQLGVQAVHEADYPEQGVLVDLAVASAQFGGITGKRRQRDQQQRDNRHLGVESHYLGYSLFRQRSPGFGSTRFLRLRDAIEKGGCEILIFIASYIWVARRPMIAKPCAAFAMMVVTSLVYCSPVT